jgi:hypothetical protein
VGGDYAFPPKGNHNDILLTFILAQAWNKLSSRNFAGL